MTFQSTVDTLKSELAALQQRCLEDAAVIKDLRAEKLENEATMKRLNDQIGLEVDTVVIYTVG